MLAEYWRGEITLRKLRVLIEGLPPDSAAHRAVTDGQLWTWREWLLWHGVRTSIDNATRVAHSLSGKKGKPKTIADKDWPVYPWVKADSAPTHYGDTDGRDGTEVIAFLDSFG